MVSVDDGIKVFELGFISSLKENSSCSCKFSLGIFVQVLFIIFGLDQGVVDIGAIDIDPTEDFWVDLL